MSDRIINLMAADVFFNKKRGIRAVNRLEKERYTLQPSQAYKILYRKNKVTKPANKGINFEKWQLDIAMKVMEREHGEES